MLTLRRTKEVRMASVHRAFFSHVESGYFYPGTSRDWWMTGFDYGDVVSVTAQSVGGLYGEEHGVLRVDDRAADQEDRRFSFESTTSEARPYPATALPLAGSPAEGD
jgi:hypothetical protein